MSSGHTAQVPRSRPTRSVPPGHRSAAELLPAPGLTAGAVLTVAFGTTVAMWAVGYVGRLPAVMLPAAGLLGAFLICLLGGGWYIGHRTGAGWKAGALAGGVCGLLNLLVLGSLLTGSEPNQIVPSALWWIPGSVGISAVLAAVGAAFAGRQGVRGLDWTAGLAGVAVVATMLLLAVGGLVTSTETGLAVVDWPNSYGYNMFLYPLSRMTGGIYYEHAHRLFGALVGLTTLVLALFLHRVESRRWVKGLGWLALVMVIVQGILGGLRVTGSFTTSTDIADMAPSITLAVVHGVFGQVFFALLVALAAICTTRFRQGPAGTAREGAATDHTLTAALVGLLILQLVLGAIQRHTANLLAVHIALACIVAPLAVLVGMRAWGLNDEEPLLKRIGVALASITGLQVALGMGAFVVTGALGATHVSKTVEVSVATAHQWVGALMLGCSSLVAVWSRRLLRKA